MKLNTVNVIEFHSETIQAIHSFSDDKEGNAEAEKLFGEIAKENGFDDKDVEFGLEEGQLDRDGDDYILFIVHS